MKPLRFCHLTTFYPPHNFGGDGIGIQRLARALAKLGHHNTVIHDVDAYQMLAKNKEPKDLGEPPGVEVIHMESGWGKLSCLMTQQLGRPVANGKRIAKILEDGKFDVINFHNISLIGGPGILKYGDAVKLYMAHEHWLVCPSHVLWRHNREVCTGRECTKCVLAYGRPPQMWRYTNYLEHELAHVDAFIAMSRFSREKHREFGFPREMEVLPYFLPEPEAPTSAAPAPKPLHTRPYFLFVGRLEKIKGLDDVIPIFRDFKDADLLICGDGEHADALKRIGAGIDNVRFLGRVSNEDLASYYEHALALIVPSIGYETFGIILIEAFRSKIPVIARRIGPFPEILETAEGGELFGNPAELIAAMRRFQSDPAHRSRCAAAGHAAFLENWTERAVVPRYLDIVRRAAEHKGRKGVTEALTN
ncbi:MAG: glycosyltransferase family 4 protein [Planctomycetes bacterium]|nr:glycosyltransferase family 4 protein [Planctomycetota bacterium]